MIQSFTATTREIDDAETAVAEVVAALDPENNLRRHSLGVVSCFPEFAETGALAAICGALPFDCVGATTSLCSSGGEADQVLFAITVLTSDDCSFGTTEIPLSEGHERSLAADLDALIGGSAGKPALLLSYLPLMKTKSGDRLLAEVDTAVGGIPLFGMTAADDRANAMPMTIRNGCAFREAAVLGAIYGAPRVSFQIASIDESKTRNPKAIITESDGNTLIGVNEKAVLAYIEEIGLTKEDVAAGLGLIPFAVDCKDGTKPVVRAIIALTPENHVVCGGVVPVGATMALGQMDMGDVLHTTEEALKPLLEEDGVVLSYSCLGRYFALGARNTAEAERVSETLGGVPYLFAYSSGEICPLPDASGRLRNFYHNYANVLCRLG